jgi:hypothetical protein
MDRSVAEKMFMNDGYLPTRQLERKLASIDSNLQYYIEKAGNLSPVVSPYPGWIAPLLVPKAERFLLPEVYKHNSQLKSSLTSILNGSDHALVLQGDAGTGKTCASYSVLFELWQIGKTIDWVTWYDLLDIISQAAGFNDDAANALYDFTNCDALVIDEFCRSNIRTDARHEGICKLINTRDKAAKITIYTTNCTSEEIGEAIGKPILDRIGSGAFCKFAGKSLRGK